MQDERFTVKYISVNTCFVYLPESWLRRLSSRSQSNSTTLCVEHNKTDHYLSWCSSPGPESQSLCLGATFARSMGIKEGDQLRVTSVDEAPSLTSVHVVPKSAQDRVVLELQSENVQANLLDQIRVVAKGQPIVAWISRFNCVTLIVSSLSPQFRYGRLENQTEIHVGDVSASNASKTTIPRQTPIATITSPNPLSILGSLPVPLRQMPILRVYRVRPLPKIDPFIAKDEFEESFRTPFCVYLREKTLLPAVMVDDGEIKGGLWRIRKVKEDRHHVKTGHLKFGKKADVEKEFVVRVRSVEDSLDSLNRIIGDRAIDHFAVFRSHVSLNLTRDLVDNLRLKTGGKVIIEPILQNTTTNPKCTSIEIYPHERFVSADVFKNYVTRNSRYAKMLLNTGSTVSLEDGTRCLVKLMPDGCNYGLFDEEVLKGIEVRVSDAASIEDSRPPEEVMAVGNEDPDDVQLRSVARDILEPIIQECDSTLRLSLGLHNVNDFEYDRENVLISGATGSGKTTVCKLLQEEFTEPPYFTHASFVDCKALKGKKVEVVQKLLITEMSRAVHYQPAILFLDDIDSVTSASSSTDENTPDAMNAARVTDAIFNTITEYQETNYISVIATCTDVTKVGKKLREARGLHFFRTILSIPPLEKEERIKILRSSLEDKLQLLGEIDWEHYANKTEGWVAQDLLVLADKAAFTAWKRHVKEEQNHKSNEKPILLENELEDTLSRCTPMSLHGVNLYRGEGHSWSDIGGLADVKRDLVEILHWPLRYPHVFKAAPIKLQSGILIYGMPGTGKTMLAGAIAKECGLNLISVKGPELLSKYIGASEEAVRNVFEKAHRAKPCVLFFDEFDSLAPRRGHDSTGVTDRVVNQLLTHLDGIEGREGVAVVAASSRPDLLDPALLRPGRLDKALLCPLPDEYDRIEILSSLCRLHGIETNELDLGEIAAATSGFTGADLNAVLMQARLDVIEEAMESSSAETKEHYDEAKVTQEHLTNAVKLSKPSLPVMEKQKYNRIYEKFARCESSVVDEMKHQKATLA